MSVKESIALLQEEIRLTLNSMGRAEGLEILEEYIDDIKDYSDGVEVLKKHQEGLERAEEGELECAQCGELGTEDEMELHPITGEWLHPDCADDYDDEQRTCPNCHGHGGTREHPCRTCGGSGRVTTGADEDAAAADGDRRYDEMVDRKLEEGGA